MIGSPHLAHTRLVRWLTSSRFASDARAVFESSPFFGIDGRPLSPVYCLSMNTPVIAVTMRSGPARIVSQGQYTIRGDMMSISENKVLSQNIPTKGYSKVYMATARMGMATARVATTIHENVRKPEYSSGDPCGRHALWS